MIPVVVFPVAVAMGDFLETGARAIDGVQDRIVRNAVFSGFSEWIVSSVLDIRRARLISGPVLESQNL